MSPRRTHFHHQLKVPGFTIVELLVVVTIIAVLIGLLLPAMSKARERVRAVRCQANQHQVSLGIMVFATDHRQYAPGLSGYSGVFGFWPGHEGNGVAQWISHGKNDQGTGAPRPDSSIPDSALIRTNYINDRAVFRCPELDLNRNLISSVQSAAGWNNGASPHFIFNLFFCGETSVTTPLPDIPDYSNYWDSNMAPGLRNRLDRGNSGTYLMGDGLSAPWYAWSTVTYPGSSVAPLDLGANDAMAIHPSNGGVTNGTGQAAISYVDGHGAMVTVINANWWGAGKVPSDNRFAP